MFMRIFKLSVHLAHITPRSRRPLIQRSSTSRIIVRLCTIAIRASSDEHKRPLRTQLKALRRGWAGFDKSLFLSNETDYFIVKNDGDEDVERMIINLFNWSLSAGWVARQFDVIIDHEAELEMRCLRQVLESGFTFNYFSIIGFGVTGSGCWRIVNNGAEFGFNLILSFKNLNTESLLLWPNHF